MRYAPGYTGPMLPGPRPRDEVTTMPVKPGRGQTGGPKPYTGPARPVPSPVYTPVEIPVTSPVGIPLPIPLPTPPRLLESPPRPDTVATTMTDSVGYKKGGAVKKKSGGYASGSKIDLGQCKVSTASRNKKNSNW